jgi:membrane fusion protein, multidrug efflux system
VAVRTGASDGRYTEILSGLEHGDQVVVRGYQDLRPGTRVAVVPWEGQGPAKLPEAAGAGAEPHAGHGAPAADPHAGHGSH